MLKHINLYKIKAVNGDVVMTTHTVTSEGLTIYFNHMLISDNRTDISNNLISGDLIAISVDGVTEMTLDNALTDLAFVGDIAHVNDLTTYTNQVMWNLEIANQLIASVRGEMIEANLPSIGLNGSILLSKLSYVIGAVQVGMFKEAAEMMSALERDDFLTDNRINRYVDKLTSADAISY